MTDTGSETFPSPDVVITNVWTSTSPASDEGSANLARKPGGVPKREIGAKRAEERKKPR